jgi:hypothetical protein
VATPGRRTPPGLSLPHVAAPRHWQPTQEVRVVWSPIAELAEELESEGMPPEKALRTAHEQFKRAADEEAARRARCADE